MPFLLSAPVKATTYSSCCRLAQNWVAQRSISALDFCAATRAGSRFQLSFKETCAASDLVSIFHQIQDGPRVIPQPLSSRIHEQSGLLRKMRSFLSASEFGEMFDRTQSRLMGYALLNGV